MADKALTDFEKLKKAQDANLLILEEIDRLCRLHGITYLLDSGTLIGAVRHEGFIPWDDDVDIAFTRENWERFKAFSHELKSGFSLLLPEDFAGGTRFFDFTPRVIFDKSIRSMGGGLGFYKGEEAANYYEGRLNHLWVDIFILDNDPDSALLGKIARLKLKALYGMAMHYRFELDMDKYKGMEKLFVMTLSLMGRLVSMPRIFKMYEKTSVWFNKNKTKKLYYSNYQPDWLHCSVEREWSESAIERSFEGKRFMCPKDSESVLTMLYGDYMKLPPEEKRVPTHSEDIEILE
ncbi:MAG: LicD family protein [Eubacteriales bacterium]|nr:LicD family protein [Eubacteriales bacterium]